MFDKSSHVYDLLYTKGLRKDYAAEADLVGTLLPPTTTTLLDVACGTGLHLEHFASRYDCAGTDLDERMLAFAAQRCPDVPLVQADMVDLDLGRRFDAVVCLFSSIGYVGTDARLRAAVAAMAGHLQDGGMLVVEPWHQPDDWRTGYLHALHVDEPDVKISRMSVSGRDGDVAVIEFHYLVATPDGIEHLTEEHRLGLFTWEQYRDAFEASGLETTVQRDGGPMGRGLVIGRKG